MAEFALTVNLVLEDEEKTMSVPCLNITTAEDVCMHVCKYLNITTIARHLFALRITGEQLFLMPSAIIKEENVTTVDLRIRFKVASITKLKKIDVNAYNYYFQQARKDVLDNKIPDLVYDRFKEELVGLGITDMFRVMLEKKISRETVENDYKKYIPKEILKKHIFFIKKLIHTNLGRLSKSVTDASYVMAEYVKQLDLIAPEYLSEVYKAQIDQDGSLRNILVKVSPSSNITYCSESKRDEWKLICTIEELGFISIRNNGAIEISRKNGIPFYLKFRKDDRDTRAFISLLDGYYRLTCKWTFNICKEVITPSLKKLQQMKCHGPVGGEFSYAKLEDKRANRTGCFIIRESETNYNTYYIDVCVKDSIKPKTYKVEKIKDEFIFNGDITRYKTIQQLIKAYSDPEGAIFLQECLPPSEYDLSQVLLCRSDSLVGDSIADTSQISELPSTPVCINFKDLQVYKGNLTDLTICKISHVGIEYTGFISKTESNVRCQSWDSSEPHKVSQDLIDNMFPFGSKKSSRNYCRNPDKRPTGPWCYTMNNDLIYESCAIPLCSFSQCRITGPGIEYGGTQSKGFSGRKCLKWDKSRKKVFVDGNFTTFAKFDNQLFPEGSVSKAKRYCRNPDGQIGGPWCFIENEESDYTEKEYCDIPFCQEPECMVYTKNYDTYMHYTDFNGSTFTNLTFGLRLWDSDNINNASARLVLSVLALPVTGKELHHLGIGIEVYISNNVSSLRYGNNDKPEFEETPAIIKSTNFTTFSLSWHRGFITLSLEGEVKPIFLAEMKTKHNLVGFEKDKFSFYSAQGTNLIWNFPFCMDECDIQTTTGEQFQQFWPLREKDLVYDCQLYVRAVHSAMILIVPTPATMYPYFKIVFNGQNNYTKITLKEYQGGSEVVLEELQLENIISYWEWSEFSISFFANSLQIYMKKTLGMHSLLETKHEAFRLFRWFSVSSDNSIAHWSFFCQPPTWANPPPAFLPECALNPHESDYKGTQDITSSGLPCLPWSASDFLSVNVDMLFKNESLIFHSKNYCRNPESSEEGAFCYTLSSKPEKKVAKTICHLRKCKSDLCKIAGTGNDFIGQVSVTRSGRPCDYWDPNPQKSVHFAYMYSFNGSYFAEMNARDAKNFCRNPSRDISGSWCYTRDPEVVQDVCSVRDCDKPEECIIIISTSNKERKIFILPQWKEVGLHGGLRFGLKQWNPDYLGGIAFHIFPREGQDEITFVIGAQYNEKVELYFNNELTQIKTFPHLIAAGKWTEFWLQVRRGELLFGLEGVPAPLFEWKQVDSNKAFEPIFITYTSLFDTLPIAIFFKCDECHTENTTANNFLKFIPIGLGSLTESKIYRNLTLKMRGVGVAWISLMWVTNNLNSYQIKLDTLAGQIGLYRVEAPPQGTVGLSYTLVEKNGFENLLLANNWTKFDVSFFERTISITRNNELVLQYNNNKPILAYWFSIASAHGWVSWSANCEPLELDGTPRDGGWSPWSSWTCSVSCGGGEGYRTRTCSNPYPNIFGKLCQGSPTATGKCNDFPCGDLSVETLEKIYENLQTEHDSYLVDEHSSVQLMNNDELLKIIKKESPEAFYEWTLNGMLIKPTATIFFRVQKKEGSRGFTVVYKGMWRLTKGKKIEVAIKMLTQDSMETYLKDYLNLLGQWSFLRSPFIVRLFGIAFINNITSVLEFFKLGPLDQYLRDKRGILKSVDLVEAASNLASAVWHLKENDIVHGKIRCRKLMVSSHDENSFTVKLTDPGVHTSYEPSEVHWIPVEYHGRNLEHFKKTTAADVWALATTLYEIFTYGADIKISLSANYQPDYEQTIRWYASRRLQRPPDCPNEIYTLMLECWEADPHRRKQPQAISRDINQLLYQVYNSRKNHSYATVSKKPNGPSIRGNSEIGVISSPDCDSSLLDNISMSDATSQQYLLPSHDIAKFDITSEISVFFPNISCSTITTSLESLNSMQSVFELDDNWDVILQGRIGQGFYGEVFKGQLEKTGSNGMEVKRVAVKRLKSSTESSLCLQDFEREIEIMKTLRHPNIVEILGVLRNPEIALVMEYVQHGSLQSFLKINKETLKAAQLLKFGLDIAKGMEYLGKKNIVHRDLAARNILVADENHVKISDFGLAQVMGANDYYILKTPNRELPIRWYAPESLRDGKFSVRSDVWSFGVTMCEMFNYGEEPQLPNIKDYSDGQEPQALLDAIEGGARFPCPAFCQQAIYIRVIYPCWENDPHKRPLFRQIALEIEDLLMIQ